MYKFYQTKLSPAFTIIELLITIVIVGILVAITAVGYGGVTKRAEYANIQTSVSGIEKAIEVFLLIMMFIQHLLPIAQTQPPQLFAPRLLPE